MDKKGFSISEVLSFAWQEWKKNWGLWIGTSIFAFLVPLIPEGLLLNLSENAIVGRTILVIIHLLLAALAHLGFLTLALKAAKQEPIAFGDFFSKIHLFPSYLIGKVLYILGMSIGLLLFIVPGVIFALKFNLWPFYVIDRSSGGVESLSFSNQAVYGSKWDLLLFWVAAALINSLGLLFFGIGLLITWPLTLIAWSKIYLKLTTPQIGEV